MANAYVQAKQKGETAIWEDERVSIPITPDNATFYRGKGGLVSLTLKSNEHPQGEEIERVVLFRAFPITNPKEYISVREPDTKKRGHGKEIGMIRYLEAFDKETQDLLTEELDRRYFSPVIQKITSVKEKFGYLYFDTETSAGKIQFILQNPFTNIRILEDGRIFIHDIDGNNFQITDPKALDPSSFKKIEMYL